MVPEISEIRIESYILPSIPLKRDVIIDLYMPETTHQDGLPCHLLLINDGQDLVKMSFEKILAGFLEMFPDTLLYCAGIHCGPDRRHEYGVAGIPDYQGRGSKAGRYEQFVLSELLPLVRKKIACKAFTSTGFCGFSLGGLTALDLVWRHPDLFSVVGVFSGSLWWRSVSQERIDFNEEKHRIIHQEIRKGKPAPGLRFFFETGTLDETADRNNNGIIDSIDDTLALIGELENKGYDHHNIYYLELKDGRHDLATWGRAFPVFLEWAYGNFVAGQWIKSEGSSNH